MVARIRLEAEDATKAAFDSATQNANKAQQALDGVKGSLNETGQASQGMGDSLSRADAVVDDLENRFANLHDRLNDVAEAEEKAAAAAAKNANAMDRTGDEAAQSAEQIRKMDAALEKVGGSGGPFVETMAKLWALKETFTKLAQGANYLAEQGNPAFVELRDSATHLFDSLMKLAELEEVQTFIETLASGFEGAAKFISDNAENVDWLVKKYKDLVEIVVEYMEYAGLVADGTTEELRRMKELEAEESKRYAEKLEAEKLAIQSAKQQAEADKALHDFKRQQAAQQEAEDARKIESYGKVAELQEAEIKRMNDLAAAGKLTAEEIQDTQRRLQLYEQRKTEIEKAAIDKTNKEKEEAAKKSEELSKQEADASKKAAEQAAAAAKTANDEKLKGFEDYVNKLVQAVESTKQQDKGPMDGALREATSGRNLLREVVDKRQLAAEQQMREDFIGQGKETSGKDFEKELAKLRKQVQRDTVRQANRGEISPEELGKAQEDLAGKIIDNAEKTGTIGRSAAEALREQAKAIAKQNVEQERIAQDLEQVKSMMEQLNGRNNRRVDQRRGY